MADVGRPDRAVELEPDIAVAAAVEQADAAAEQHRDDVQLQLFHDGVMTRP